MLICFDDVQLVVGTPLLKDVYMIYSDNDEQA
jgi:hypothetical protein